MDGVIDRCLPQLDTSLVAGKITRILGEYHEQALQTHDDRAAARFDVGLDTIYYASLLLTIVNGSGETRGRADMLAALDTTRDVIAELRRWVEGQSDGL